MDNSLTFLNACRNGQKSIVQIFLKKGGIDVNKRDAEGNTPLHHACLNGHRDIVSLLLENKGRPGSSQQQVGNPAPCSRKEREQRNPGTAPGLRKRHQCRRQGGKDPAHLPGRQPENRCRHQAHRKGEPTPRLPTTTGIPPLDYATAHGLKSLVEKTG